MTYVVPSLAEGLSDNLQARAGEVLFGDNRFRPDPRAVADLIQQGLTEDVIRGAAESRGLTVPEMELTDHDLDIALPYYQQMSDTLAGEYPSSTILFAGRDAEVLYDDFAITHPGRGFLLPASSDLWISRGMRDRRLSEKFLGRFGLNLVGVSPPAPMSYVLVDSGFHGTIGERLSERLRNLYGISLLQTDALVVRLMHADPGSIGKNIIELPKTDSLGLKKPERVQRHSVYGTNGLAILAQILPRYFGPYSELEPMGDEVVAVPARDRLWRDLDDNGFYNDSVVNPVGAALVQFRVVRAALQRAESSYDYAECATTTPNSKIRQGMLAKVGRAIRSIWLDG